MIEVFDPDKLKELKETKIGEEGMRIDRELFKQFEREVVKDNDIRNAVENEEWQRAENLARERFEDKPELFVNLEKIRVIENLDRQLTWRELLQRAFGIISRFKTQDELLEDECAKYISITKPEAQYVPYIKNFIKAYVTSGEFRNIIDFKRYQDLHFYAGFTDEDYRHLNGYREGLPEYIKDNIELKKFA